MRFVTTVIPDRVSLSFPKFLVLYPHPGDLVPVVQPLFLLIDEHQPGLIAGQFIYDVLLWVTSGGRGSPVN